MPNALATCTSPYLRQHADNPVDWQPWGEAAMAEARRRDVPLLISIGYATCHWCHVMAHEAFERAPVAAAMNRDFVCVKVDREEHPEVDAIYMDAVQALTGHGGWPLNAFAAPDGRPFYACTYLPVPQWLGLLDHLSTLWRDDRARVERACADLAVHLADDPIGPSTLGAADDFTVTTQALLVEQLARSWDDEHPGWAWNQQRAPKFPANQVLPYLLETNAGGLSASALATLTTMQDAGLHDRVGGGFHRYSVDRQWRVPHFEKMLYDNAQLIVAYGLSGQPDHRRTAEHAGNYIARDLRVEIASGSGRAETRAFAGYATAEDADDPHGEGSFYAWTPASLTAVVGETEAERLATAWNLSADDGTSATGHSGHREPVAGHIPHPRGRSQPITEAERQSWEAALPILRAARTHRPRPIRDDKVLTDQNALTLEAFAVLNAISGSALWRQKCTELAAFLATRVTAGGVLRLSGLTSADDRPGTVTDYGFLVMALPIAYDQLGDPALIALAERVADEAIQRLGAADGSFFTVPEGRRDLIRRGREFTDNAWPGGHNAMALGCARLAVRTGLSRWRTIAERAIAAAAPMAKRAPTACITLLRAQHVLDHGLSVVVSGDPADLRTQRLLTCARRHPQLAVIVAATAPAWPMIDQRRSATPEAHVCTSGRCLAPVAEPADLETSIVALQRA